MNSLDKYITYNGVIIEADKFSVGTENRAFRFGDSVFETIKVSNRKILFADKHYSRLIRSFKILSYRTYDYFTKEYFENLILDLVNANKLYGVNQRVRLSFFRKPSNDIYFVDSDSDFEFIGESYPLHSSLYSMSEEDYRIDVYSEIRKSKDLLASLKTNNVLLHSIAGQMVKNKALNNVLLINSDSNISEAANANVFFVKGDEIITVPTSDGCVEGVFRSQIIDTLKLMPEYKFTERSVNIDELGTFDEIFLTNCIMGIQSVDFCKTTGYKRQVAGKILRKINEKLI